MREQDQGGKEDAEEEGREGLFESFEKDLIRKTGLHHAVGRHIDSQNGPAET